MVETRVPSREQLVERATQLVPLPQKNAASAEGNRRPHVGAVGRLAGEAVEIFMSASGGSSIYTDVPIQRIHRDIRAANLHALMHPSINAELYGRMLCGLEPNTQYV